MSLRVFLSDVCMNTSLGTSKDGQNIVSCSYIS